MLGVGVVLAFTLISCGGDATPPFGVSSEIVSHETTQYITVWAPDAEGSWPVVWALHGIGGNREDLAVTARALAREGVVVFAADYRSAQPQLIEQDAECSYRFARSIAAEYGGDLDQPTTLVGYSLGASLVLVGGLDESAYGPDGGYDDCFSGTPRPDVVVAIDGCHYEYQGQSFGFSISEAANQSAQVILVAGENDTVCEPRQSQDATAALQSAGYDARLVEIPNANHFSVIFHDLVDDEWITLPEDDPVGTEVVQTILEAIEAAKR
jgi:dienelactone hydrolase